MILPDFEGLNDRQAALALMWWGLHLYKRAAPDDAVLYGLKSRVWSRMSLAAVDRIVAAKRELGEVIDDRL